MQQKIDHEIKMRDGTAKLLAASKNPDGQLEAAKNLLASNTRMLAYMTELQKRKTSEVLRQNSIESGNQEACKAKLCISDVRIPLMWKQTDHFKNKGDHRRYAVFCLWKIDTEIFDTSLLRDVDREMTDLSFDDVLQFADISPDFACTLELYCHKQSDDFTIASTHRKIKKKFSEISDSIGRSVGKKISGLKDDNEFLANMLVGPKFEKIASATLRLKDVSDSFGIYDLTLTQTSSDPNADLPLFGHFCCRMAAVPRCLTEPTVAGTMDIKSADGEWSSLWCVLMNLKIACWSSEEDSSTKIPEITIPFTKEAQVHQRSSNSSDHVDRHCLQITTTARKYNKETYLIGSKGKQEYTRWWTGLQQHLLDQALWQHTCDSVMDLKKVSAPRVQDIMGSAVKRNSTRPLSSIDTVAWKEGLDDSPMTKILARLNVNDETPPAERAIDVEPIYPTSSSARHKLETDV